MRHHHQRKKGLEKLEDCTAGWPYRIPLLQIPESWTESYKGGWPELILLSDGERLTTRTKVLQQLLLGERGLLYLTLTES